MTDMQCCPFCGSGDIDIQDKFTGNYKHGKPVRIIFCRCSLCGVSSRPSSYTVDIDNEYERAVEKALEAWNRRPRGVIPTDDSEHWNVSWSKEQLTFTCSFCESKLNFIGRIESFLPIKRCPECLSIMNNDLIKFGGEN